MLWSWVAGVGLAQRVKQKSEDYMTLSRLFLILIYSQFSTGYAREFNYYVPVKGMKCGATTWMIH